ncbi:MAG: aldo/keto reductase [Hyphomicrobiales bacterium]|nr:MAG: aldo/keto reductase [Hyphomicrobiales bacterium]
MGFGTFDRTGDAGIATLLLALETGYRHLDTAQSYGTEAECGAALKRSGLKRNEVFLTTKVTGENCQPGRLVASLEKSRENLGVDRIDLTLIHWPVGPSGTFDKSSMFDQLLDAQSRGLTRLIGVSNFTIADIEAAKPLLGNAKLATNQFERHLYLQNTRLVDYCKANGITVTCYLPLARGASAGDPVVEAIADKHNATPHQIALAFSMAQGHVVIPTSGKAERVRENFAAGAIKLSADEVAAIEKLDRNGRQINPAWAPNWD